MDEQEIKKALEELKMQSKNAEDCELSGESIDLAISVLEQQLNIYQKFITNS